MTIWSVVPIICVIILVSNTVTTVISIDLTTESNCGQQSLFTKFISCIARNINLEEACVSLRHAFVMGLKTNCMLISQILTIWWHTLSTPDKLKIKLFLFFCHFREDSPESIDKFITFSWAIVFSDTLKNVNIDNLFTGGSDFDFFPIKNV